jgi:1,2-phenylacetyl-CoA epoxidase PaaB subunit
MYHYEDTPTLRPYYDALERMIKGDTLNVAPGTRISRKTVALEAGKTESAIKRGRAVFTNLNAAIDVAASKQAEKKAPGTRKVSEANQRHRDAKAKAQDYKELYEKALARELMLLKQLDNLERSPKTGANVIAFGSGRKR